jgi:threonine dehydrogenase-like Zn-dependent dehydrogenase
MNTTAVKTQETYYIDSLITLVETGKASFEEVIEQNISLSDAERLYNIFNTQQITV